MKRSLALICSMILSAFTGSLLFAKDYRVPVNEDITIGVSQAFECVAMMAHLAGFEEYNGEDNYNVVEIYDSYFNDYLNDKIVKKSLDYFNMLREKKGFSYDAVAIVGTYLSEDCHSYRLKTSQVQKIFDKNYARTGDAKKLLKVISDFYDATDFESFFNMQTQYHRDTVSYLLNSKSDIIASVDEFKKYFRLDSCKININTSVLNYTGNYGTSFVDGDTFIFEPKYAAYYFDGSTFIHELCHPYTRNSYQVLLRNPQIKEYVKSCYTGHRAYVMKQSAYGTSESFFNELINRSSELSMVKRLNPLHYVIMLQYYKLKGFYELEDIIAILDNYYDGNYNCYDDFIPELEKGILDLIEKQKIIGQKRISKEEAFINGKAYKAEFCGGYYCNLNDVVHLSFYKIEDKAFDEIKQFYSHGSYINASSFPCQIAQNQCYKVIFTYSDGSVQSFIYVVKDEMINDELISNFIWVE